MTARGIFVLGYPLFWNSWLSLWPWSLIFDRRFISLAKILDDIGYSLPEKFWSLGFLVLWGCKFFNCFGYTLSKFLSLLLSYGILCRMLTWEDAYYDSDDYPEKKCPSNFVSNLQDRHCSHDPLGIALAKMSYHVYPLGEGYDTLKLVYYSCLVYWIFGFACRRWL